MVMTNFGPAPTSMLDADIGSLLVTVLISKGILAPTFPFYDSVPFPIDPGPDPLASSCSREE